MSMVDLLNSDSPRVLQPDHLKVKLYPHQLASIYKLKELFNGSFDEVMKTKTYVTNFNSQIKKEVVKVL